MEHYLDPQFLMSKISLIWEKLSNTLFCMDTYISCAAICVALLLAYVISRPLSARVVAIGANQKKRHPYQESFFREFPPLIKFIFAIFILSICSQVMGHKKLDPFLIDVCSRLLTAWALIRFGSGMLRNNSWTRLGSMVLWAIAVLHILGLLPSVIKMLGDLSINIGGVQLSMLLVGKAIILFTLMLKAADLFAIFAEKRVMVLPDITPSTQVLLIKILKIALLALAVIITMGVLGINLSAFAFIGGAVGVGVGFGLQKVVSNLVSGIILLMDRSIKPGDVIEIGSTYGRIQSLGARYVSVTTRDNTEYLIPNEDLIVNQVVNWSFSNSIIRLKILFPVSYNSDIQQVIDLILTTAVTVPRVLRAPKPSCQLKEFGDSSINMELRLWISDPHNGVSNVKSAVRIAVWEVFKENGIDVPFPQMDIHMSYSDKPA